MHPDPFHRRGTTTFHVACGVIIAMAIGQGVVAAWGWKTREAREQEAAATLTQTVFPAVPKVEAPAPAVEKMLPAEVTPVDSAPDPAPPTRATLDVPITDEQVLENLDRGLVLRQSGDTQGALEAIRAAWQAMPDHPKLLYQLATTLDLMGLAPKAQAHWKTLHNLGPAAGDIYFKAADLRLKEQPNADKTVAAEEREGRYKLTDITVKESHAMLAGVAERQVLRFKIRKLDPAAEINAADFDIKVHVFDQVKGRVDRTTALKQEPVIPDGAFDFKPNDLETIEMTYEQPAAAPEDIVKYGQRRFYGYCIEIWHKGKLQDAAAEPLLCLDLAREIPEDLPPAEPPEGNTDGSLFPKSPAPQ